MNIHTEITQVGAPDPELHTSFIVAETDEDYEVAKQEVPGEPACRFNEQGFDNGQVVCSGNSRLQCNYGVWVRVGSCYAD